MATAASDATRRMRATDDESQAATRGAPTGAPNQCGPVRDAAEDVAPLVTTQRCPSTDAEGADGQAFGPSESPGTPQRPIATECTPCLNGTGSSANSDRLAAACRTTPRAPTPRPCADGCMAKPSEPASGGGAEPGEQESVKSPDQGSAGTPRVDAPPRRSYVEALLAKEPRTQTPLARAAASATPGGASGEDGTPTRQGAANDRVSPTPPAGAPLQVQQTGVERAAKGNQGPAEGAAKPKARHATRQQAAGGRAVKCLRGLQGAVQALVGRDSVDARAVRRAVAHGGLLRPRHKPLVALCGPAAKPLLDRLGALRRGELLVGGPRAPLGRPPDGAAPSRVGG